MSKWLLATSSYPSASISCHILLLLSNHVSFISALSLSSPAQSLEEVLSIPCIPSASAPSTKLLVLLLFRPNMILSVWNLQWLPNFSRNKFKFVILVYEIHDNLTWLSFSNIILLPIHCMFQPLQESFLCALNTLVLFLFLLFSVLVLSAVLNFLFCVLNLNIDINLTILNYEILILAGY